MANVVLDSVSYRHSSQPASGLFDCSLSIRSGELLSIVGPSGAGKTTLLRLIAGLLTPDRGTITIADRAVTHRPPVDRDVSFVSQKPALYPHYDVSRNLSIGLEMRRRHLPCHLRPDSTEIQRRVDEALDLLHLQSLRNRRPHELSAGEQQRVALGRVLVRRPAVWLLDEPLALLDWQHRNQIRRDIHLLHQRVLATILFVTHDPVEAVLLGDRLAVLDAGHVRQVGEPAFVQANPEHRSVAGFLGWPSMNLTDGVLAQDAGGLRFTSADGLIRLLVAAETAPRGKVGQPVTVGLRADDLFPVTQAPAIPPIRAAFLPGRVVRLVEAIPPRWLVTFSVAGRDWSVWWTQSPPPIGQPIDLTFDTARLVWFDSATGRRLE
jgi:ABC-type sugar transport system ATPase subunit